MDLQGYTPQKSELWMFVKANTDVAGPSVEDTTESKQVGGGTISGETKLSTKSLGSDPTGTSVGTWAAMDAPRAYST